MDIEIGENLSLTIISVSAMSLFVVYIYILKRKRP